MNKIIQTKKRFMLMIIISLLSLCLGFFIGWFINKNQSVQDKAVREKISDSKFTDPLLFLEKSESNISTYQGLKKNLNNYISKSTSDKKVSSISVYFRNLNSSEWVGVNRSEKYSPASLLKVITLIYILDKAEADPSLMSKEITIENIPNNSDDQDFYPPKDPVMVGKTYTVEELLSHMIIDSDNVAALELQKLVDNDEVKNTYTNLQIPMPTDASDIMTAQQYSHLFRVLYGATYLDHYVSEQALDLLSKTNFSSGIVSGVPTGTVISHKFGERTFKNENIEGTTTTLLNKTNELHDCGIVYYPNNPYFICVMTKGDGFPTLEGVIKDISKIVWDSAGDLK